MRVYGHRGFAGIAPENTMASFREALKIGVDGIECDVHLSKDGHIVVCHDPTLDRTTNGTGPIGELDWVQLRALDAGSWFSPEYAGERIHSLAELLELVSDHSILLNIELKTEKANYAGLERMVVELLTRYGMVERSTISSFNFDSLVKIKSLLPDITTAAIYKNMDGISDFWDVCATIGVNNLHPRLRELSRETVAEAHRRGYVVNVWTPDDRSDLERALAIGVDGVITNYPNRAKSITGGCSSQLGG